MVTLNRITALVLILYSCAWPIIFMFAENDWAEQKRALIQRQGKLESQVSKLRSMILASQDCTTSGSKAQAHEAEPLSAANTDRMLENLRGEIKEERPAYDGLFDRLKAQLGGLLGGKTSREVPASASASRLLC